jgi:hypothetical protein
MNNTLIRITELYGPSIENDRNDFLQEIKGEISINGDPWLSCGDLI